jgi:tRNA U54 and U55 pseudouridine synthase Pus10
MNVKKKVDRNKNFREILSEFNPDVVLLDRISKIGKKVIEQNIPLLILLRGNLWEESSWAKKTIYKLRYKKNSLHSHTINIDADGGLPIKRFVEGNNVVPNISEILSVECFCKKFDINQITLSK